MKQALGLIETKGTLAAIEASDVMLKSAEVHLLSKEKVGGGLVTVTIEGDVAAVKTAVDAASSAVDFLGKGLLLANHVIARPESGITELLTTAKEETAPISLSDGAAELVETELATAEILAEEAEEVLAETAPVKEELMLENAVDSELENFEAELTAERITQWVQADLKKAEEYLKTYRVVDLRKVAKEHPDFIITRKELYRTSKEKLIEALINYFNR